MNSFIQMGLLECVVPGIGYIMILMTLNCRGLASKPKKLAICRLVEEQHLDVVFGCCVSARIYGDWGSICGGNGNYLEGMDFFILGCTRKIWRSTFGLEVQIFPYFKCLGSGIGPLCIFVFS